jgi:hypothetical protein
MKKWIVTIYLHNGTIFQLKPPIPCLEEYARELAIDSWHKSLGFREPYPPIKEIHARLDD